MNWCESVGVSLKAKQHEHRYAFYSPRANEVVLVKEVQHWTDKKADYVICKKQSGLYGQPIRADFFNKKYPVYIGDIGLGTDYHKLIKQLGDL